MTSLIKGKVKFEDLFDVAGRTQEEVKPVRHYPSLT
jgi:hypothetical protein